MENITCSVPDFKKENRLRLFGHEDAGKEKEQRLSEYYFRTNQYEDVCSDIDFQMVVGEKGTGKSALLKMAYIEGIENKEISIWIRMEDLSELYSDLLEEEDLYKLKMLWKKAISRLVVMRLAQDITIAVNEDYQRALQWAYDLGYAQKDFISHAATMLKPLYDKYIEITPKGEVNESKVLERLIENKRIRLYLDDFDLDWKGNSHDVKRIKSLILSLGDLTSDMDGLSARMALRTDVFDMIRNEEFSDKYESSIVQCRWNNRQILRALAKRICTYYKVPFDEKITQDDEAVQYKVQKYLNIVFESRFDGNSRIWTNAPISRVIYSLIRRKPRDMVKLCLNVSEYAYDKGLSKINGDCFTAVLDTYSQERLRDVVNEYKNEMPQLEAVLIRMTPTKQEMREKASGRYVYTTAELYAKIQNILQNVPVRIYNSTSEQAVPADFHEIAHFLYKIGFITGRKNSHQKVYRVYYDEAPHLLKRTVGDNGYAWEIHPAYRAALAKSINDNWAVTITDDLENEE